MTPKQLLLTCVISYIIVIPHLYLINKKIDNHLCICELEESNLKEMEDEG